jgi:hypothetical protein
LSLTDATTNAYQAIYVTIKEIRVHKAEADTDDDEGEEGSETVAEENGDEGGNGWETILTPEKTYNLMMLVNCKKTELGIADLAAGHYTQMRLILGGTPDGNGNILGFPHVFANYLIDMDGNPHELKVPSGFQTGLKLVRGFDIIDGETTDLILDFDAAKSVVKAGNSGKWQLKPTIKIIDGDAYGRVSGTVDLIGVDDDSGVYVSAQTLDAGGEVIDETGTITESDGTYCLVLDPGAYTLVVDEEGYVSDPVKIPIVVEAGGSYVGDDYSFELLPE